MLRGGLPYYFPLTVPSQYLCVPLSVRPARPMPAAFDQEEVYKVLDDLTKKHGYHLTYQGNSEGEPFAFARESILPESTAIPHPPSVVAKIMCPCGWGEIEKHKAVAPFLVMKSKWKQEQQEDSGYESCGYESCGSSGGDPHPERFFEEITLDQLIGQMPDKDDDEFDFDEAQRTLRLALKRLVSNSDDHSFYSFLIPGGFHWDHRDKDLCLQECPGDYFRGFCVRVGRHIFGIHNFVYYQ